MRSLFETSEDCNNFVNLFPKSTKVFATSLSGLTDGVYTTRPMASFGVNFNSTGVTGDINETGLKRLQKFLTVANANGYEINYVRPFGNSLTEAEFNNLIGVNA